MLKFTYELKAEEIEEAWVAAQWKNILFQRWNQLILMVLALGFILFYSRDSERFYLIICAVVVVILLVYNAYFIPFSRRRKARKLEREKGIYGIQIDGKGVRAGKDWNFYSLGDKKWELLEAESVYALKIDREVFCIPKRILSREGTEALEKLTKLGKCSCRKIITGEEKKNGRNRKTKNSEDAIK